MINCDILKTVLTNTVLFFVRYLILDVIRFHCLAGRNLHFLIRQVAGAIMELCLLSRKTFVHLVLLQQVLSYKHYSGNWSCSQYAIIMHCLYLMIKVLLSLRDSLVSEYLTHLNWILCKEILTVHCSKQLNPKDEST